MGLDMYLDKCKLHGYSFKVMYAVNSYFELQEYNARPAEKRGDYGDRPLTMVEWVGEDEAKLATEKAIEAFKENLHTRYPAWDTEHKYPSTDLWDSVGYWRKANQIHNWFVENVQGGNDDCDCYPVSREQIEELKSLCEEILANVKLIDKGENEAKEIDNKALCEDLLPTCSGFFFGDTEYDEWYLDDIKNTVEICNKALYETDWDTETLYYVSSW